MRLLENKSMPRVTFAVVALTCAAWLAASVLGVQDWATVWGGVTPARVGLVADAAHAPFWITPLTATLVHGGLIHLAFNMVMLVFCGRPVERALGPAGLAIIYLVGAYAAAGAQYAVDPAADIPMVGASGAISAVLGAYAILFGRNKVKVASPRLAVLLNALWLLAAWVVLNLILKFILEGGLVGGVPIQVAIAAHIGGFLLGLVLAYPLLLFRWRKA